MNTPKRIQRQRTPGWRMPEGAVYVDRPSKWGNPFRVGEPYRFVREDGSVAIGMVAHNAHAAELFDQYVRTRTDLHAEIRAALAGRDLACWCPVGMPCHGDSLLRIANEAPAGGVL